MRSGSWRWLLLGLLVLAIVGAGLIVAADDGEPTVAPTSGTKSSPQSPDVTAEKAENPEASAAEPDDLSVAESLTREDSYYPEVGDPGVDSLHHDLDLIWDPESEILIGTDTLTFRATADADEFQLDLGEPLEVESTVVDGEEVDHKHEGKDLVVRSPVEEDGRYVVEIAYSGTPVPAEAPTTRQDFSTVGWTITDTGEVWTMQEPYGAYTWYPVNDQPADKALYDFTITVPSPWVGVASGLLEERRERGGHTITTWHTDEPMSSYLTTIAIGDYEVEEQTTDSGVPISLWVPRDKPGAMDKVRFARKALEWVESKLGAYPFSSAGIVVTDSRSGMETQTMITLGDNDYVLSREVIVHEFVHQWYGDQVSPTDWRDVWMNEGMTMYLQAIWESENGGPTVETTMDDYAAADSSLREQAGPPGAYDPGTFGEGNIYYLPAVMWHELREQLGDEEFWAMVRAWPLERDNSGATREEYYDWIEQLTGEELTEFFEGWISGDSAPARS